MARASLDKKQFLDPRWRLNNLYWIVDKKGERVPFRFNDGQARLIEQIHGRDIILKARQRGFTTVMALVSLDECLFNPDWRAAIIAHKLDDAKIIFQTKIKFPYENLPDQLRARLSLTKDSADALNFSNGSSVSVTTSARSGTLQRLHISEFGKICAQYPAKAREIITGSFPAAEGGSITIESTAEGQEGAFFEMSQRARALADSGRDLDRRDWKFHFFPWWEAPEYVANPDFVVIGPEDAEYFRQLEADHGIALTPEQKAWWVQTSTDLGGDMKREHPSTPDEAFEQAIEGAYFSHQLAHAEKHGLIGSFPVDPAYPVNTFWDLGRNDFNVLWFHQHIRGRNRFVHYYENTGEHVSHYVRYQTEWARDHGVTLGDTYWPHDGARQDLFLENGRLGVAADLGISPRIVQRPREKLEAIETGRTVFVTCDFDEASCKDGLKRLRHYRKDWDDQRGVFRDRPRHDDSSHAADGFLTFACGWVAPTATAPRRREARPIWAV